MKRYSVKIGNMIINVFSDKFIFPNKDAILKLYDTDIDKFKQEIEKIKYDIKIND